MDDQSQAAAPPPVESVPQNQDQVVPSAPQAVPSSPVAAKKSNSMLLVAFIVIGVVLAGVFISLYTMKEFPFKPSSDAKKQQVMPSPIPSPTVNPTTDAALEVQSKELNNEVDAVSNGLKDVDQGLHDQQGDLSEY